MKRNDTGKLIRRVIACNIRALRKGSGQSQAKFAEMIGVNRSYMNQIEHGKMNISVEILVKIADGLDVPITELFKGLEKCAPHKLPHDNLLALVELPDLDK